PIRFGARNTRRRGQAESRRTPSVTRIGYHEAAERELLEQVRYFELQSPGLGRRFLTEAMRAESRVLAFPFAGAEVAPGIRRRLMRSFPFALLYTLTPEGILILAVAHTSRRPDYWADRR